MKDEKCVRCNGVIPAGACQQGQFIQDTWYPLHVGCADEWCDEMIPVWKISYEGAGYTEGCLQNVTAMLESMDDEEEYEIKKWSMKRIEYLKLPEFTGF